MSTLIEYPQGPQAVEELAAISPLVDNFLHLIAFDTQADENQCAAPSTPGQLTALKWVHDKIVAYAQATGRSDYKLWQNAQGVLILQLPPTAGCDAAPHLLLLAHIDTAPDCSGKDVKAQVVKAYRGGDIALSSGLRLTTTLCPELKAHVGEDILVTDGTTLLGADDKAGCAVLLTLIQQALHEEFAHGPLSFAFTVDEEIGRSADYVPLEDIGANFGVTIDGCAQGELDVATFNAASCKLTVHGRAIHTGTAYGKLINAVKLASSLVLQLPENQAPETTRDKEGFYHVYKVQGTVEEAQVQLILRDYTKEGLQARKDYISHLAAAMNAQYSDSVSVEFTDQYVNMGAILQQRPQILALCRQAYAQAGVEVHENWVRGGTDGSNLSARGLPCPNIFTGALNCHGPYECLPLGAFHKSLACTQALIKLASKADLT